MANLVSDIITQAFIDLGVIAPGETASTDEQSEAFRRLNQMLDSWSAEGAVVFNQVLQTFGFSPGVSAYTLGSGGSWATTGGKRAFRITAWIASYLGMRKGGAPLPMDVFAAEAAQLQASLAEINMKGLIEGQIASFPLTITAAVPSLLGADMSYPLLNVRVFPPPASPSGSVDIAYWTALAQFATSGDTVSLPPGFEEALHTNLAMSLYPQYARPTGPDEVLAANAQRGKSAVLAVSRQTMAAAPAQ